MAAVCRRTWADIRLVRRDGHRIAAEVAYLASRCSTASRLSARPRRVGKSGSVGPPRRSASQTRRVDTVPAIKGVIRFFRPFPRQLTCGAVAKMEIAASQPDEFGGTQTGLDAKEEERIVAPTGPRGAVWAGEQGSHLLAAE